MNITSAELLRLLASGSSQAAPNSAAGSADAAGFATLLQKAQAGSIASERQVTIRPEAKLTLTDEQLARVALAADRAESQGAMRAAVLIDGKALTLDVTTRQITGQMSLTDLNVATGIDAVVAAPQSPSEQAGAGPVPLPPAGPGYGNPSLLRVLSQSLGRAG